MQIEIGWAEALKNGWKHLKPVAFQRLLSHRMRRRVLPIFEKKE